MPEAPVKLCQRLLCLALALLVCAAPALSQTADNEGQQDGGFHARGTGDGEHRPSSSPTRPRDWPLRWTFAGQQDTPQADSSGLIVTDMNGTLYLKLSGVWPTTSVRLPAGKYLVTTRYKGRTETREVTLDGSTGRDVYFHWSTGSGLP